jgi:hypothetical protein
VVAGCPTNANTGTKIQRAPAGGHCHHTQAAATATVAVSHRGGRELVLGQHGGDVRLEKCGVVEVFNVGAVDAEDVVDPDCREVSDDVVDHTLLHRHLLT